MNMIFLNIPHDFDTVWFERLFQGERAMKKIGLIAILSGIMMTGVLRSQVDDVDPNRAADIDGDTRELTRREESSARQKETTIKKWRRLEEGMTQGHVRRILGEPKLIQGGSHECIWFYQDLPVSNAKPSFLFKKGGQQIKVVTRHGTIVERVAVSDVGGVKDGIVFFELKDPDSLFREDSAKRRAIREARANSRKATRESSTGGYGPPGY
ncbi:MAG: hypothetical protein ACYSTJ_08295, partial [Planctomycetota bacterium]